MDKQLMCSVEGAGRISSIKDIVLGHVCLSMDLNNTFKLNKAKLAKEMNLSRPTLDKYLLRAISFGLIKVIGNKMAMIDPKVYTLLKPDSEEHFNLISAFAII